MRNDDPIAMQVGRRNLLDAAEFLALDRSELREIDFWPRQKIDAADSAATCSRRLRLGRYRAAFGNGLDVGAQNTAMVTGALDLAQIYTELPRQPTHRGAGIGESEGLLVEGTDHRRLGGGGRCLRREGLRSRLCRPRGAQAGAGARCRSG